MKPNPKNPPPLSATKSETTPSCGESHPTTIKQRQDAFRAQLKLDAVAIKLGIFEFPPQFKDSPAGRAFAKQWFQRQTEKFSPN